MIRRPVLVVLPAALLAALLAVGCGATPSLSPIAWGTASAPLATPAAAGATLTLPPTPGGASEPPTEVPAMTPDTPTGSPAPTPRFALTSAAFSAGGAIPARFTCDGRDLSPGMTWTGTPAGTRSLVLLVDDPDAHGFAHWIAYAIDPTATALAEGAGAAASHLAQGTNDFGRVGYGGPCPPSGTHHYVFTLYALAAPLGLSGSPRASAVRAALARAHVLGRTTLTATYRR